jgi:hypothetical protein
MKLQQLAIAHLLLCAAVLLWDLWVAGRAAQLRTAPRPLVAMSGLGGLLLLPALAVHLLAGSLLTGHAFASIAWIWPLTVALVAAQAIYAVTRGLLSPVVGIPLALYDLLLALIYAAAYLANAGYPVSDPLLVLVAAERGAIVLGAIPAALSLPWYLHVPIIAPCSPFRRGLAGATYVAVAALALAWGGIIVGALPGAANALRSYAPFAAERLRERPEDDFTIGIKIFPTLGAIIPTSSVQRDLAIADSIGTQALSIYLSPRGASAAALRSLAETLDDVRGERQIIVALDLSHSVPLQRATGASGNDARDLEGLVRDVARIARIVRPDYLVPVVDPLSVGTSTGALIATPHGAVSRAHRQRRAADESRNTVLDAASQSPATTRSTTSPATTRSTTFWENYIAAAARAVHAANPATRVMAHIGGFSARDSALYAWSASRSSPVDAVALTLFPGPRGAPDIRLAERTIDSWLVAQRDAPGKEHWILEAGGYPTVHGELSQSRALWGILAWATNHPIIRGVVAYEASDYAPRLGLQTPSGRLRLAAGTLKRAIAGLGE